MKRLKNSSSELETLKELLLADELTQLKKLEEKVDTLDFEARDDATIMKRVTPAISKGIASNKEAMIDALYPIMGGMISKYVTQAIKEMMETINKKIEQGLSFERYKRKAKAKITGVSESELLLEESSAAYISSMFVIHKETSLLIAEAHLENKEIDDAHMVASMASAIKDFINDWVQNSDDRNEVQLLSYGNATLYIEGAGSVFIIAFLDAEPDQEQRININAFFAVIVKKYASFFQKFEGDDSTNDVVSLSALMKDYLYEQEHINIKDKNKANPVKYFLYFVIIVLLGYGLYLFNTWYIKNSLEDTVYSQTRERISLRQKDNFLLLEGQVASMEVIREIEKIMKRHSKMPLLNHLSVPVSYIDERFKNNSMVGTGSMGKLEKKLESLEINFEKSVHGLEDKVMYLQGELKNSEKHLKKILKSTGDEIFSLKAKQAKVKRILQIRQEIHDRLDIVFANEIHYNQNSHTLDFRVLNLFPTYDAVYDAHAIKILSEVFDKYISILAEYKEYLGYISIDGHSDSSGMEDKNINISKKRALSVKYYLQRLKRVKQYHLEKYIKTKAHGSSKKIMLEGIEDKKASRRIEISFTLKDEKILKKLGKIIND